MESFEVKTRDRNDLLDITQEVMRIVSKNGTKNGLVTVLRRIPAAVTINENADPSVRHDLIMGLTDIAPTHLPQYKHLEGILMLILKPVWWARQSTNVMRDGWS